MTLSTLLNKVQYSGDDVTTAFPISFPFLADSHIVATLRDAASVETVWTLGVEYTLTGGGGSTGTLTAVTIPATGETLTIQRVAPLTQETDYPENGKFPAASHEDALDKLTMIEQQQQEEINRAPKFPVTDPSTAIGDLPVSTDRASLFAAYDADGKPIAAAGTSANLGPVTAFIDTLLDDTTAAIARATLDAASLGTGNTFTAANIFAAALSMAAGNDFTVLDGKIQIVEQTTATAHDFIHLRNEADGADFVFHMNAAADLLIRAEAGGTGTVYLTQFNSGGLLIGAATGGDPGAGIINASNYQKNGTAIAFGLQSVQVFTGNGTWTKPAGITNVKVTVIGGGGGGGGNDTTPRGSGGGGGCSIEFIDVTGTASETVTVGAGGTASGGDGVAGGTSSFGAFCSATGGGGGTTAIGGAGGAGSGGDINMVGGDGSIGPTDAFSWAGGSSFMGGGGGADDDATPAPAGNLYGGGGASGSSNNGGAGAAGIVIVEEYIL